MRTLLSLLLTVLTLTSCAAIGLSSGEKFSGEITGKNHGCWSDGACSIEIGNVSVIYSVGGVYVDEPWGTTEGITDESQLGETVEVYAKKLDENTYTIYGSTDYYIRVVQE